MKIFNVYQKSQADAPSEVISQIYYIESLNDAIPNIYKEYINKTPALILVSPSSSDGILKNWEYLTEEGCYAAYGHVCIHYQDKTQRAARIFQGERKVIRAIGIFLNLADTQRRFELACLDDDIAYLNKIRASLAASLTSKLPLKKQYTSNLLDLGKHSIINKPMRNITKCRDKKTGHVFIKKMQPNDGKHLEVEPAISELHRFMLGPTQVPEMYTLFDDKDHQRVGVLSEIKYGIQSIYEKSFLTDGYTKHDLLKGGLVEAYVYSWLMMDNDLHQTNIYLDSKNHVVLLDFDRSLFPHLCKYFVHTKSGLGFVFSHFKQPEFTPNEIFQGISAHDLACFPVLDRKPLFWTHEYPENGFDWPEEMQNFLDEFNSKANPDYIERQWYAFLKAALIPDELIDKIISTYIGSDKGKNHYRAVLQERMKTLRNHLFESPEFIECYRQHNASWVKRMSHEINQYNLCNANNDVCDFQVAIEEFFMPLNELNRRYDVVVAEQAKLSETSMQMPSGSKSNAAQRKRTASNALDAPSVAIRTLTSKRARTDVPTASAEAHNSARFFAKDPIEIPIRVDELEQLFDEFDSLNQKSRLV